MTKIEFLTACGEYCIEPSIALENDAIIEALQSKDDAKVLELLATEF
jgi:hypothetical protein